MAVRCSIGPPSLLEMSSGERRGFQGGEGLSCTLFLGIKNGELAERTQYADSGWHSIKALQEV